MGLPSIEDTLLVWRLNHGDKAALLRIYEKYKHDLVTVAAALLAQAESAEDVVHDVFVVLLESAQRFHLTGSLKGYLATCVANRARNVNVMERRRAGRPLDRVLDRISTEPNGPAKAVHQEHNEILLNALETLPYEQREVVVLHTFGDQTFKAIARQQGVSVNTACGRYRYGLQGLRAELDGEATK